MEIAVLGPLVVGVDGKSVVPTAAKPRQLLALLAVGPGREVSVAALVDELWEQAPPRSSSGVVQTYVMQLRRSIAGALGPDRLSGAKDILSRGYDGYVLNMPQAAMDSTTFEQLATRGLRLLGPSGVARDCEPAVPGGAGARDAVAFRAAEDSSRLLSQALSMWRGPALAGVRPGPALRAEAARLDEIRRAALEGRITADLRTGRHAELVSELTALTACHPLQESLHAQLMLAHYRCGRTWESLEVFRKLRESCAVELGIEPSARLQRLHRAILSSDPMLEPGTLSLATF